MEDGETELKPVNPANPYQPPATDRQESGQPREVRPLSVWILLALCLIAAGTTSALIVRTLLWVVPEWKTFTEYRILATALSWRLAVVAVSLAMLIGVWQRRKWARWLAMMSVCTLTVALIVIVDTRLAVSESESVRSFIGHLTVVPVVLAVWLYRFGWASRSNRYFKERIPA